MASHSTADDPWDWSLDRVVQELCTTNRSWQPRSALLAIPDPDSLERALREQEVTGSVLLLNIDDNLLRNDFGLKALGRRCFVLSGIEELRLKSAQYQDYVQSKYKGGSDISEQLNRSMNDLLQRLPPNGMSIFGQPTTLGNTHSPGLGVESLASARPSDDATAPRVGSADTSHDLISDEPGSKRRKLNATNSFDDVTPQFENGGGDGLHTLEDQPENAQGRNGILTPGPEPVVDSAPGINGKKRKRIAPTLITSEIDPNRNRELPTDADNVFHNDPQTIEPGVPFIGEDGKKRLVPICRPDADSGEPYHYKDLVRNAVVDERAPSEKENSKSANTHDAIKKRNLVPIVETLAMGYLGKRKMLVDSIFYEAVAVGEELANTDDGTEISIPPNHISSGRRLYVHGVMKHFLRAERQVITRGDKFFSAIRPYPNKLAPKFQKPSFTLYYSTPDGEIHARREEVPAWPEIDPEAAVPKNQPLGDEHITTFNPLGPDLLNNLGSYDNWDESCLEKYKFLEGGDEVLPLYGESDEENEYDLATWKEIEEERGSKLDLPLKPTKRPHISRDEINEAIDEGIDELVLKWKSKALPKRENKAYRIWMKSRFYGNKRDLIVSAQKELDHIVQRVAKMRYEILSDVWTSKLQVRKQTRIMEVNIFTREDLTWKVALLEQKTSPVKPPQAPSSTGSKKATVRSDDGEEGESIESDSEIDSSDDGLEDFVVPDEILPTTEQERFELNLADSEEEDDEDATMTDGSISDHLAKPSPAPVTPSKATRSARQAQDPNADESQDEPMLNFDDPLSPPSVNNICTPEVKGEKSMLPKLPKTPNVATSEVIDLTVLSSDDSPQIINLITPKKRKSKIKLIHRNSPFSNGTPGSASDSDADALPNKTNLPPYNDPAAIARFSYKAWARSLDKERLLISVFYKMDDDAQTSIFDFLSRFSEQKLWDYMKQVMDSLSRGEDCVKGMDARAFNILTSLIRLFRMYIDRRWHADDVPSSKQLSKVLGKRMDFTPFYKLCSNIEGYLNHRHQATLVSRRLRSVDDEEDEDPLPAIRRRLRDATSSDEDAPVEDTPRKKRRKLLVEDEHARDLRANDRLRLIEQEARRMRLQANLAMSGHADDENRGRIIINDAAAEGQGFIYVHPHIAGRIKKHQIEGVRFMWNQIVTLGDMQGCLLAHTMGLGKTLQSITLLVAIAAAARSIDPTVSCQIPKCLQVSRTLVLCPPGLLDNWEDELLTWTPPKLLGEVRKVDSSFKLSERLQIVTGWANDGGVLLLGYEMFRILINNHKKNLSQEQHEKVRTELLEMPNIIIADEAHKMKNAKAEITTAAMQFKSASRIALTGSPLANNIEEYHTMIDWVCPNYLGPIAEFREKYVEPIQEGLYRDSTHRQRRKGLKMLGVLKDDIAPKVHRADMSVLSDVLPPKKEFVITIPLTDLQIKAYSLYVQSMISGAEHSRTKSGQVKQTTLWSWIHLLSLLCNHPSCFNAKLNQREEDAEKGVAASGTSTPLSVETTDTEEAIAADINTPNWKAGVSEELVRDMTKLFKDEAFDLDDVDLSFKVKILCQILDASRLARDKTLVFSHSIPTLNFLEKLCIRQNRKFTRLDGNTLMSKRQAQTKDFNNSEMELYLISTRAGGLGLNLPGANRVVIFDFQFNPIMEEQAIGRAYRIGQEKNTFVYRFISGGTFEELVHNKVVFKSQLSARVVDKKNPVAWATKSLGEFLCEPKDVAQKDLSEFKGMDPLVLDGILESQNNFAAIRSIVQSDAFERDDDDKLTADEEKEVRQMLDDEKLKRSDPGKWQELLQKRQRLASAQQAVAAQATRPLAQHALRVESSQRSNSSGTTGHANEKPAILPPQYSHSPYMEHPTVSSTSNAFHPPGLGARKEAIVKAASQPVTSAVDRSNSPEESTEKRRKIFTPLRSHLSAVAKEFNQSEERATGVCKDIYNAIKRSSTSDSAKIATMERAATILQTDRMKSQVLIESKMSGSDFVDSLDSIPKPENCPSSNLTAGKVCNSQQSSRSPSSCDFIFPPILPPFKDLKTQRLHELKTSTSSSITEPTLLKSQNILNAANSPISNVTVRPEPAAQLERQETSAAIDLVQEEELIEGNADVGIPIENPPSSITRGIMSIIRLGF